MNSRTNIRLRNFDTLIGQNVGPSNFDYVPVSGSRLGTPGTALTLIGLDAGNNIINVIKLGHCSFMGKIKLGQNIV